MLLLTHSRPRHRLVWAALLLVGVLVLGGCTLAGEPVPAGPVERSSAADLAPTQTPVLLVELPPDVGYPVEMPDAAEGAALFAARCAACHGPDGSGQGGQMAAALAEQGARMPDFTDADFVRQRAPQDFFRTITEGRLEAFMPPWGQELTEAERWSLTYFLYTLSASQEELERGREVYEANCAACHGADGRGDGPQAPGPMPDLTDRALAVTRSPQALFETVTLGAGEAMPAFEGALSEDERRAVVAYLLTFGYLSLPSAEAQVEAAPLAVVGEVSGVVTNRTTNSPLGEGHQVLLHGLIVNQSGIEEVITLQTTTDAQGGFFFDNVPLDRENLVYVADLVYEGIEFNSLGLVVPGETTALDLPISVYDTTQDPAVISVDSLHIVISPQSEDSVLVAQIYVFSNASDRVYVSDQAVSDTRRGTVRLPVPPDAVGLAFEDGELGRRYIRTTDGVLDTAAVLPGEQTHNAVMTYLLPFDGEYTLTIPLIYNTGQVSVLSEETDLRVQAEGLTPSQADDPQLEQYQILTGQGFGAGEELVIMLKGAPGTAAPGNRAALIATGGLAALALLGAGVWWRRRGGSGGAAPLPSPQAAERRDRSRALMQAIADLDDAFEAGRIGRAQYEARRARLKADLVALAGDEDGGA